MNEKYVGKSLKSLNIDEMNSVYGAQGEVEAQITPATPFTPSISAGVSVISGIVSYNKSCLG